MQPDAAPATPPPGPSRERSWERFNRIAARYDRASNAMSMGAIRAWRAAAARPLRGRGPLDLLDLATGTAEQLLSLVRHGVELRHAVGLDLSEEMLARGREKIAARGLNARIELRRGDALALDLPDASFDAVLISFGIRNLPDPARALREMRRVLRPGGLALVLETRLPTLFPWRTLFRLYNRLALPLIGRLIAADREAFAYMNRTIATFPSDEAFCALLREAGFGAVRYRVLPPGPAALYLAEKS